MTRQEFLYYTLDLALGLDLPQKTKDFCRLYFDANVAIDPLLSMFGHGNYRVFKDEILHFLVLHNPGQYTYLDEATKHFLISKNVGGLKWPDLIANSGQAIEMKTVYGPPKASTRIVSVVRDIATSDVYMDTLVHIVDSSPTQDALTHLKPALEGLNVKYTVVDHSITKPLVNDTFETMASKLSEVTKAHAPFAHPRGSGIDVQAKARYITYCSNRLGALRGLPLRVFW